MLGRKWLLDGRWTLALFACIASTAINVSARADSANSAGDQEIIRSLFATSSDEEKLRAIDHAVTREATSLEVRSAIRRISISSSSAEVRGAARFALMKLQSLAPATKPDPTQTPDADVAVKIRQWSPKESVEDIAEPTIDEQVVQTGGLKSRLPNIKLPGVRRPEEVTVVEITTPQEELEPPVTVNNTMPIPELPQTEVAPVDELPAAMTPVPVVPVPVRMPAPEKMPTPALPPMVEEAEDHARQTNLADKLKAWRVVHKPTPEEMMNGMHEEGEIPAPAETPVPVPTLIQETVPPAIATVQAPAPTEKEAFIREEPKSTHRFPTPTALPPAATIETTQAPTPALTSRPIPRAASLDHASESPSPPTSAVVPPAASPAPTPAAMQANTDPTPPPSTVAEAPAPAVPSTSLEDSIKAPRISLNEIPRDLGERKRKSRTMLDEARQAVKTGDLAAAESILFQVREFAVEYGRFQYSPEALEREISQARALMRREAAAQTAARDTGAMVR